LSIGIYKCGQNKFKAQAQKNKLFEIKQKLCQGQINFCYLDSEQIGIVSDFMIHFGIG